MRRCVAGALLLLAALAGCDGEAPVAVGVQTSATTPADETPRALLERSARAYRDAPALEDRMKIEFTNPDEDPSSMTVTYRLGAKHDGFVSLGGLDLHATGGRMYLTREGVDDKYLDAPMGKDFPTTAETLFNAPTNLPAPFAMRAGMGYDSIVDDLGLGFLVNGRVEGGVEMVEHADGRTLKQITVKGDNGSLRARIDDGTGFLHSSNIRWTPPRAPEDYVVQAAITFAPEVKSDPDGLVTFDTTGLTRVSQVQQLVPTPIGPGDVAPDFTLPNIDGEMVTLSDLRGSVVVLDFWATWCKPCIMGMPYVQQFDDWARSSGEPVEVFAVDIWERDPTPEARRERATKFWRQQKFTMSMLLDLDGSAVGKYHFNSIPTTVVIGPDGRVAKIHRGFDPNIAEVLKQDVAALLEG